MSIRLSSWRTASRVELASRSQSTRGLLAVPMRCRDRLIEARLQTATLSRSCGRVISVQRLERWIVPVLLLSARVLIVSFQVSHGCDVVCRETRIARYCSRALHLAMAQLAGLGQRDVLGVARGELRAVELDQVRDLERVEEVPVVVVARRAS